MKPVGHYWAAAAFSGFASQFDWRAWADEEIEKSEAPDDWIISLALASNLDEIRNPLTARMRIEEQHFGRQIAIGNAKLGYIYWGSVLRRYPFERFLAMAGDEADGGTGDLDCEIIYKLLSEFEQRIAIGSTTSDLQIRADKLFSPFLKVAKEQWALLGREALQA